jgi:GNAT superfamily N-acetyltransferase
VQETWRIEPLDKQRHDRKRFDCGKSDLNDYLQKTARRAGDLDTGRTFVIVDAAVEAECAPILGYYTLANCHVDLEALPDDRRRGLTAQVPATLIGRFAVDKTRQGEGLGRYLLVHALRKIEAASREVASHAVVVDALDEEAEGFYLRFGFENLLDGPRRLFLPMETIRQLP